MSLPQTLADWRKEAKAWEKTKYQPYDLWRPLIPFFQNHGLALWETDSSTYPGDGYFLIGPEGIERAPDGFSYLSGHFPDGIPELDDFFQQINPIICPARTSDGRDVIIRLVRIENDPSPSGARHLSILRRIGKGHVACIGSNHIVPVLQELTDVERGLTFVVQPKLWDIGAFPKWYTAREAADFVVQIFEGLDFCHKHLIAHLDIGHSNILANFRGGSKYPPGARGSREDPAPPFRSHFPIRYYLNDFELGILFDESSDPSARLVTGDPLAPSGREGPYGRPLAPEMAKSGRYCPFRADVWEAGMMMKKEQYEFEGVGGLPEYQGLFSEMVAEDPLARPTMSEALRRARELRISLPEVL